MPTTVLQGFFPAGLARPSAASAIQPKSLGPARPLPPTWQLAATPGERLPPTVQAKMEGLFGADFSNVRVHVGPEAPAIGALAFTHGSHLYFAPGHYNPATSQGQRLLGHELTHVVQQRAGRVRNPFAGGGAVVHDPRLDAEAERMGGRAVSAFQQPYRLSPSSRSLPSGTLQKASAAAGTSPAGGASPGATTPAAAGGAASGGGQLRAVVSEAAIQHVLYGHTVDGIAAYAREEKKLLSQGGSMIAVFAGGATEVRRLAQEIESQSLTWTAEAGGRRSVTHRGYKFIARLATDGSRVEVESFFPTSGGISRAQLEAKYNLASSNRLNVQSWRRPAPAAAAAAPPPPAGGGGGTSLADAPAKHAPPRPSTGGGSGAAPRPSAAGTAAHAASQQPGRADKAARWR